MSAAKSGWERWKGRTKWRWNRWLLVADVEAAIEVKLESVPGVAGPVTLTTKMSLHHEDIQVILECIV